METLGCCGLASGGLAATERGLKKLFLGGDVWVVVNGLGGWL